MDGGRQRSILSPRRSQSPVDIEWWCVYSEVVDILFASEFSYNIAQFAAPLDGGHNHGVAMLLEKLIIRIFRIVSQRHICSIYKRLAASLCKSVDDRSYIMTMSAYTKWWGFCFWVANAIDKYFAGVKYNGHPIPHLPIRITWMSVQNDHITTMNPFGPIHSRCNTLNYAITTAPRQCLRGDSHRPYLKWGRNG